MPEQLPVPLELPRPANMLSRRRHLDDFEMYGSLSDFQDLILQTWADEVQKRVSKKFLWLELDGRHKEMVKNTLTHRSVWNSFLQMSTGVRRIGDKILQIGQFGGAPDMRTKPSYI